MHRYIIFTRCALALALAACSTYAPTATTSAEGAATATQRPTPISNSGGTGGTLGSGSLFSLTLTGISLDAGGNGASLTITGGSLAVYSFTTTATAALYVKGSNFNVTGTAGPVHLSLSNVNFLVNGPVADWTFVTGAGLSSSEPTNIFRLNGGAASITAICLLAAPEGCERLERELARTDVPVTVVTAAMDEKLNEKGYIVPGLGDAGDRLYGLAH